MNPQPYKHVFTCEITGITTTFTYRGSSVASGIQSAVFTYPPGYDKELEKEEKLPKKLKTYINPKTGRTVSYQRAVWLGIVEK